jgi:hypothetical protein
METAVGVKEKDILPGEERYAVSGSLRCRISIPDQVDVIISIPRRVRGPEIAYEQPTGTCVQCLFFFMIILLTI